MACILRKALCSTQESQGSFVLLLPCPGKHLNMDWILCLSHLNKKASFMYIHVIAKYFCVDDKAWYLTLASSWVINSITLCLAPSSCRYLYCTPINRLYSYLPPTRTYLFPSLALYLTYWPTSWHATANTVGLLEVLRMRVSCLSSCWLSWLRRVAFCFQKFSDVWDGLHCSMPVSSSEAYTSNVLQC